MRPFSPYQVVWEVGEWANAVLLDIRLFRRSKVYMSISTAGLLGCNVEHVYQHIVCADLRDVRGLIPIKEAKRYHGTFLEGIYTIRMFNLN